MHSRTVYFTSTDDPGSLSDEGGWVVVEEGGVRRGSGEQESESLVCIHSPIECWKSSESEVGLPVKRN